MIATLSQGILANGGPSTSGYLIKDTVDSAAHTGVITNTLIKSYLIRANTFVPGDWFQQFMFIEKVGTNGTNTIRTYVNTSANLTGATQLTTLSMTATTLSFRIARYNSIKSSTETLLMAATSAITARDTVANLAFGTSNINWSVDQYFIIAFQLTSALDTAYLKGMYLLKT